RTADGHEADSIVVRVAELSPQRVAVSDRDWIESGDVAGELVVVLHPLPDQREPVPELVRHDVVWVADEQCEVTNPGVAGDLLDHLRVVVRRQRSLCRTSFRHRLPTTVRMARLVAVVSARAPNPTPARVALALSYLAVCGR